MIDLVIITERDLAALSGLGEHVPLATCRAVTLVYPWESGTALLGLSAGQNIEWDFPDGLRHRLRVEDVIRKNGGFHAPADH